MRWKRVRFWFHHPDAHFYRDGLMKLVKV